MAFDLNKLKQQVAEKGQDQSKASAGTFELPKAGKAPMRLVGYFELGKVNGEWKGKPKVTNRVRLVFELLGKNYPPREFDGVKEPIRITLNLALSTGENSGFFALFTAMNWEKKAKNMVELLGEGFIGEIEHVEKGEGDKKRTYANIKKGSVGRPFVSVADEEGNISERKLDVPAALTELKAFVWDFADEEMWDSIFIPGEWEERKDENGKVTKAAESKNVIQRAIMEAINFKGLPIYDYAMRHITSDDQAAIDEAIGGAEVNNEKTEDAPAVVPQTADDALADIV